VDKVLDCTASSSPYWRTKQTRHGNSLSVTCEKSELTGGGAIQDCEA